MIGIRAQRANLLKIEVHDLAGADRDGRQWLWVESSAVIALRTMGESASVERVFDRAVPRQDRAGGDLRWLSGQQHRLVLDASRTLRPGMQRMLEQHWH